MSQGKDYFYELIEFHPSPEDVEFIRCREEEELLKELVVKIINLSQ
jgi:hypothetical protein